MKARFNKLAFVPSEVTPYVQEFFERQTLQKLGFTFSGDNLFDDDVRVYCLIDAEIAKLNHDAMKRTSRRGK